MSSFPGHRPRPSTCIPESPTSRNDENTAQIHRYSSWPFPERSAYDEPMDIDLSPNSLHARPASTLSRDCQSPESDQESHLIRRLSAISPVSWKTASHAIGSIISLKNRVSVPTHELVGAEPENDAYTDRPYSAPPFPLPRIIEANTKGEAFSKHIGQQPSSSLNSPHSMSGIGPFPTRKRKIGYGILEKDSDFSQYPTSPAKLLNSKRPALRKVRSKKDIMHSNKTISMEETKAEKGRKITSVVIFLLITSVIILFISPLLYIKFNCSNPLMHFGQSIVELESNFKTSLFGQHIAASGILDKVERFFAEFKSRHYSKIDSTAPFSHSSTFGCKPLVLSFHGSTGVGKTFVSRLLSHLFSDTQLNPMLIPLIFPHASETDSASERMTNLITGALYRCQVNIFVLDEMDRAPGAAVKGLLEAVELLSSNCDPSYPTILLLLSNTHATKINVVYRDLLMTSQVSAREDLTLSHFESIFKERGQWYDILVKAGYVDAFLPFLPLEEKHVVQCIGRELHFKGISANPEITHEVLKELHFSRQGELMFSSTGCKRVSDKVDLILSGKGMANKPDKRGEL